MLINLRNALMAGKRLPYDAEVAYLQGDGNAYINTGYIFTEPAKITCRIAMSSSYGNTYGYFGASDGTGSYLGGGISCLSPFSDRRFAVWTKKNLNWTSMVNATNVYQDDTLHTMQIDVANGYATVAFDETSVRYTSAYHSGQNSYPNIPMYVFGVNSAGTALVAPSSIALKIGAFKIEANSIPVLDFIPVRKGTVGYLYDRVSGKLFGNAGTGDFVLGPDVVPVEYIESHGTEWIDTGLVATANNAFGAEVGFDTTVIDHGGTGTTNTVCICGANGYATSGFELRWQYINAKNIQIGGSYGNYVSTTLTRNGILQKSIVAKNIDGHITYYADGAKIVDRTATVADVGFVTGSVLLFGVRRRTSVQDITLLWAKMKYAKFYYNNNIAESLIPVRVGTGSTWEGAMMDVLTRRIYRNAGTGAFTYGNDLKYPIPAA